MFRRTSAALLAALAALAAATPLSAQETAASPASAKQTLMPDDPQARAFHDQFGYSEAVIHGDTVYLSGVVAGTPPEGMDPVDYYDRIFAHIGSILARAGSSWDDVLDITTFHLDIDATLPALAEAKKRHVRAPFPTWTVIGVSRLYEPSAQVEIKVIARVSPASAE